jgi:hypothetical protein
MAIKYTTIDHFQTHPQIFRQLMRRNGITQNRPRGSLTLLELSQDGLTPVRRLR